MPHVHVKIVGQSEAVKTRLAEEITRAVTATGGVDRDAVSVSIEDVAKERWADDVYRPDILGRSDKLYKTPGYDPL